MEDRGAVGSLSNIRHDTPHQSQHAFTPRLNLGQRKSLCFPQQRRVQRNAFKSKKAERQKVEALRSDLLLEFGNVQVIARPGAE